MYAVSASVEVRTECMKGLSWKGLQLLPRKERMQEFSAVTKIQKVVSGGEMMAKAEKMGIPSAKLSFHPSSNGKNTTMQLRGVLMEAGKERIGRDEDIDPERSHLNEYISQYGFSKGQEVYDYCKKRSEEVSAQRIAAGQKKLRKDYVPMCATIFKPHSKFMRTLTEEQQRKFLHDVVDQFEKLVGKEKIVMAALHFDEQAPHVHIFWEPVEKEEGKPDRFCAKEQHNAKFLGRLNREIVPALREKGWNLEKSFDWVSATKEQQEERRKLIEEGKIVSGMSSVEYKAKMQEETRSMEKQLSTLKEEYNQQVVLNRELSKVNEDLTEKVKTKSKDPALDFEQLRDFVLDKHGEETLIEYDLLSKEREKAVEDLLKKNKKHIARDRQDFDPKR